MNYKKYTYAFAALAVFTILMSTTSVFAEDQTIGQTNNGVVGGMMRGRVEGDGRGGMMRPGVFGTVSSISGNIITVTSKQIPRMNTNTSTTVTTTYTIDATNAKITKNNVVGTIASIIVGDNISAQGTLTGTNLIATDIRDGVMMGGRDIGQGNKDANKKGEDISTITGNGQPVIAGIVSVISGSTITITNRSNVTYTIDATNAKITKNNVAGVISSVVVGDTVIVQGTVNGNSVVASTIIDQTAPASKTNTTAGTNRQEHKGFFGSIGSFFKGLFGF